MRGTFSKFARFSGLLFLFVSASASAQTPIDLGDAIVMALDKNPVHKAALAQRRASAAATRESQGLLLPRITFSQIGIRGNDPVFVFGTRLRHQRFTAADFALNRLNRPTPIGNFSSRFSGQWTVFDSFQNIRRVQRARLAERAADHELELADQELVFQVIEAYYAALLAKRELQVTEASLKTAEAVEERSRSRVESGTAVEADLLTAQIQSAVRRQASIRARNSLALARTELALTIGMPADEPLEPAEALTESRSAAMTLAELEKRALHSRPDLKRAQTELSAQSANVSLAKSAFGPRINAFASWETDSPSFGWNGGNNWTAGLEVQIEIFDGGARRARLARERATADRVDAMQVQLRDAIRLEVRRAYYDLDTARQQVEIARAAIAQAQDSLRINQDRYETGLSTITEVMRAEEAAHRAQTDYWDAVYRVQIGHSRLALATGSLSPKSAVVMP